MAKSIKQMDRKELKINMILYWALLVVGVTLIILSLKLNWSDFFVIAGFIIPGIVGFINSIRYLSKNSEGFMSTVLAIVLTIIMWLFLGIIFGLINAIRFTNAFVKMNTNKKENKREDF